MFHTFSRKLQLGQAVGEAVNPPRTRSNVDDFITSRLQPTGLRDDLGLPNGTVHWVRSEFQVPFTGAQVGGAEGQR